MKTSVKRSLAVLTGAAALGGGAFVIPGIADAQTAGATFTIDPTTASVGDTVTFTATECVVDSPAPDEALFVTFYDPDGEGIDIPTDTSGTALLQFALPAETEPGDYSFTATCSITDGEDSVEVFTYAQTPSLTITAAAPSTTTTTAAPSTTTTTAAPAAAAAATVRPSFTG